MLFAVSLEETKHAECEEEVERERSSIQLRTINNLVYILSRGEERGANNYSLAFLIQQKKESIVKQ